MHDRTERARKEKTMNDDAWTKAGEIADRNSGGVFLRLNDGETSVGTPPAAEKRWLMTNDRRPTRTRDSSRRAKRGRAR
jgi:hypothetical protein